MDEVHFTELVHLHDADLARYCFVICGDAELARDAVQSTWERLWANPPILRDDQKWRAWLLAVAANEVRQMMRRRRRGAELERTAFRATGDVGDTASLEVSDLLRRLHAHDRQLLALRYVLGYGSGEIGQMLGLSPEGVRSRLHRLIAQIRRQPHD